MVLWITCQDSSVTYLNIYYKIEKSGAIGNLSGIRFKLITFFTYNFLNILNIRFKKSKQLGACFFLNGF